MLNELGISLGTALVSLFVMYFVMKKAVKNGILDAYDEIKEIEQEQKKHK